MDEKLVEKVAEKMWDAREATFPNRTRVSYKYALTGDCAVMARAAIQAMIDEGYVPTYHKDDTQTRPGGAYMLIGDYYYFQRPATK